MSITQKTKREKVEGKTSQQKSVLELILTTTQQQRGSAAWVALPI